MKNEHLLNLILTCGVLCGSGQSVIAQSFDEFRKQVQTEFNTYKEQVTDDFNAYRTRVNAEFAELMARPWKMEEKHAPVEVPEDVPDIPPVVLPDSDVDEIPDDFEFEVVEINPIAVEEVPPAPVVPIDYVPQPAEQTIDFVLYGTKCSVRFDTDKKSAMHGSAENDAAQFWKHLSAGDYDNVLADCLSVRKERDLCDWAYYKLLCKVSEIIYTNSNEAQMLCAWLLNQSGFKIRLASSNGHIHILVNICEDVCGCSYFEVGNNKFYIFEQDCPETVLVFDKDFPGEQSLRLHYTGGNLLDSKPAGKRTLKSEADDGVMVAFGANLNLLELYADYPKVYKDNDVHTLWSIYANAPASNELREDVYPVLKSAIAGKPESEAANILLDFVQTAFEYKTDDEAWGEERAFFPDETMYYPYSDCEDRAILYSRLVRDLMGLRAVLLYYPGHLATAVELHEVVPGDYIMLSGHRYLVCDPTFIHADIGRTMPGMDNNKVSVIML